MTIFTPSADLDIYAIVPDVDWIIKLCELFNNHPDCGLGSIQLREKSLAGAALEAAIARAAQSCRDTQLPLFINDYWQLAMTHHADGVHLGQEDLDALSNDDLTRLRESGLQLGISTHTATELDRALAINPSYVACGAIFPTTTKPMKSPPQGLENLKTFVRHVTDDVTKKRQSGYPKDFNIRTVAIGGIFADNAQAIWQCHVDSIAVVRALTESTDILGTLRTLQPKRT